jgi:hypothetical protein
MSQIYTGSKWASAIKIHITCDSVDDQIQTWLGKIVIDPKLLPHVRTVYHEDITQLPQKDRDVRLSDRKRKVSLLKEEETRFC